MSATIQKITNLSPIPTADKIETASILGWKVIVKKNEFKINDFVIYVEIDSVLPDKPEFSFMKDKNFRVKTIKMKGQISQGLILPLDLLPVNNYEIGDDVSEILGIAHYEKPIGGENLKLSYFPAYVVKTDELRIESYPNLLEAMKNSKTYITTKIDGTSATFSRRDDEIKICSRNNSIDEDGNNKYWQMYRKYKIDEIFSVENNIIIQGEIAGPGIQKNPLNLNEIELYVFNVYKNGERLNFKEFMTFCFEHHLQTVPIEEIGFFLRGVSVDDLIVRAKGKYKSGKNKEGIVVRDMDNTEFSFKVINHDFLLKDEE